jgi:uncharacterized membrane-anchored protein YjiN (DUF445 family)
MFDNDQNTENLQQLFVEVKKYIFLQKEYITLEITEKLVILLSTLILLLLVFILGMVALFYLSFTLAYLLAPLVGGLMVSYGIISILYILLILAIISMKKRLIINPMAKFIANLFFNKDK